MNTIDKKYIVLSDGIKREANYTLATVQRLKARTGKSLLAGALDIDEETLPILIYEGLVDKSSITEDQVSERINLPDLQRITKEMGEAINGSLPEPDPEKK